MKLTSYPVSRTSYGKKDCDVKSILDWTVREWFEYHQRQVHQGSLTGHDHLQQRWMGRSIWKNPLDCWVYQEILYETQPEVLVELGIAHGGNLFFMSHLFQLMGKTDAQLIDVDIDTSRAADLKIPGLHLIQGSCQDEDVLTKVSALTRGRRTMVIADCDHSGNHVLAELSSYSPWYQSAVTTLWKTGFATSWAGIRPPARQSAI